MVFAHDTALSLRSAVALVNSAEPPDTLTSMAELDAFWDEFGYTGRHDHDDAVDIVNDLLAEAGAVPRLVRHDRFDWHLHVVDPETPLDERIAAETAMAMIDVIRADETSRLDVCADDGCDGLVLDLSRNRSRRFCSTACGNRNAVAAYRARRR